MGDLIGSFPKSVWVRTKYIEKSHTDLWGQSTILKCSLGCFEWYQSRPFPMRCGLGTNQAEAGGHVTPKDDEGGEWSSVHKA